MKRILAFAFLGFCLLVIGLLLFAGFAMKNTGLLFWTFFLLALVAYGFLLMKRPQYNGFLWKHPENGGGQELTLQIPFVGQREFSFKYQWWNPFIWYPCYLFYEEKAKDGKSFEIKPYNPQYSGVGTPEDLTFKTDCIRRYIQVPKSAWHELLKFGMPAITIGVLIFGCMMALDMLKQVPGG